MLLLLLKRVFFPLGGWLFGSYTTPWHDRRRNAIISSDSRVLRAQFARDKEPANLFLGGGQSPLHVQRSARRLAPSGRDCKWPPYCKAQSAATTHPTSRWKSRGGRGEVNAFAKLQPLSPYPFFPRPYNHRPTPRAGPAPRSLFFFIYFHQDTYYCMT